MNTNVTMIPVAQLHPHPEKPRKDLGDVARVDRQHQGKRRFAESDRCAPRKP